MGSTRPRFRRGFGVPLVWGTAAVTTRGRCGHLCGMLSTVSLGKYKKFFLLPTRSPGSWSRNAQFRWPTGVPNLYFRQGGPDTIWVGWLLCKGIFCDAGGIRDDSSAVNTYRFSFLHFFASGSVAACCSRSCWFSLSVNHCGAPGRGRCPTATARFATSWQVPVAGS